MDFCDDCGELVEDMTKGCVCHIKTDCPHSTAADVPEKEAKDPTEDRLDAIKFEWEREQLEIRKKCCLEDCHDWSKHHITNVNIEEFDGMEPLRYIGGVDISFVKGDNVNACAAFVVLTFPDLKVVYQDMSMVELTAPYIAGYLAFREADFLVEKIEKLKIDKPDIVPQVIAVDGNGILHPRRCGLAVHLGVLVDIPCYGIAKNLFHVDGLEKNAEHTHKIENMEHVGDTFPLLTTDGELLGKALKTASKNPVYISAGHKISLDTCVWVTQKCSKRRIPEPTRQADLRSREYLRKKFLPPDPNQQKKGKPKKETDNTSDTEKAQKKAEKAQKKAKKAAKSKRGQSAQGNSDSDTSDRRDGELVKTFNLWDSDDSDEQGLMPW